MKRYLTAAFAVISIFSMLSSTFSFAQPPEQMVKVIVAPDHLDWQYKLGEIVQFGITVLQYGNPIPDVRLNYEIMPEKMAPIRSDSLMLKGEKTMVNGGTMTSPGFLACRAYAKVGGKLYEGLATVAYEPLKIEATTELPDDFYAFWNNAKNKAAEIPLNATLVLLPDQSTAKVNVYHISFQNVQNNSRIYGVLCIPKQEKKYPALLYVPGAGVRPYQGRIDMAEKGIITLEIGIHGIPVTMEEAVYEDLRNTALLGYRFFNLDDRDRYYFKRVYLGCVRAVEFIFSLPQFDGQRLAVTGSSQGGALAIVTAALEPRVRWLAVEHPGFCDLTGYLHGRAGGWPHMFDKTNFAFNAKKDKIETSKYYDVVNFARQLKIPGYYLWGFNDTVCPPTSMYAAYNVIQAPKELEIGQDTGHWCYPEHRQKFESWLVEKLGAKSNEP